MTSLRDRLAREPIVLAPGVYDALTASLAARAGAEAIYLSGASIAYTRLGGPDIGLVGMSEVADSIGQIRDRVSAPLIVDADTGYGNALNVQRTVRTFERMGAAAIQLEDQTLPKRCGHLTEKTVILAAEMAGKIKAAVDARHSRDTLIIARTDAVAVEGLDRALDRARLYAEAGADMLFVEAPGSAGDLEAIPKALGKTHRLMANMVEGGKTPLMSASELEAMGYHLVIFPGAAVRVLTHALARFYEALVRDGTSKAYQDRMLDFGQLNDLLGTAKILEQGQRYAAFEKKTPGGKA
jgi:2-methylisocitrate lyase-like PEP mutase family enzyme